MNDLDKLIEYLVVTDSVDECLGLKPTCKECNTSLEKKNDPEYPYYCPKCNIEYDENLNKKENKEYRRYL